MFKRLVIAAAAAGLLALVVKELPAIQREIKILRM
ncbi:MAG: DUF6893 family small protein [Streptosporangiales bacterium]